MAIKRTTNHEPARDVTHETTVCDLCGEPSGWANTSGRDARIEVVERPEYCDPMVTSFDCCAACFDARVLPALEALGFTPRDS